MLITYGFDIAITVAQPTPLIALLDVRDERQGDIREESAFTTLPEVPVKTFRDQFGNRCRRMIAPPGLFRMTLNGTTADSGAREPVEPERRETAVSELPDEVLVYLLGSRYCETDQLSALAWAEFGHVQPGWSRVQTVVDFVHDRLAFGYPFARATRTAAEALAERKGVCRDFAHLTIALCRCLNIPARYVNGYLGDIGVPPDPAPMDFSAWCEVFLDGRWFAFDARHNTPRIGRIPVAYGRDATDVPLLHTFGPHELNTFEIRTEEVKAEPTPAAA